MNGPDSDVSQKHVIMNNNQNRPVTTVGTHQLDEQLSNGALGQRFRSLRKDRSAFIVEIVSIRSSEELFERCLRQITMMAEVAHRHLVPILDAGLDAEHLFFVTPEPEQTADQLGVLGIDAAPIISDAAKGLAHLHGAGVLHRDIQLRHIGCYDLTVKLGGFSLADVSGDGRTNGVGPIGGIDTMAPSVVSGRPATTGSDVYSLGAALHLLATGAAVHPIRDESLMERLCRIGDAPPKIDPTLPAQLYPSMLTALDADATNTPVEAFSSTLSITDHFPSRTQDGLACQPRKERHV